MQTSDTRMNVRDVDDDFLLETDFLGSESTFDGIRYVSPRIISGRKIA